MATDLGWPDPDWQAPPRPGDTLLDGRYARLEPLDPDVHSVELHAANCLDRRHEIWKFLPYGPFDTVADYRHWVARVAGKEDPFFYAIRDKDTGRASGVASYLRIRPDQGSIEVGHINLAPPLQRTRAATDAMYVMMKWAFETGYRRYEWKCNALNGRSRRSAQRLGLSYEGIFRQATIVKGRNRDTAWFAAVDREWNRLRDAFETWLDPGNFDDEGRQRRRLAVLTWPVLAKRDPLFDNP